MMGWFRRSSLRIVSIIIVNFFCLHPLFKSPSAWGRVSISKRCRECHSGVKARELGLKDVYSKIDRYAYRHPGVEDGCVNCHIIKTLPESNVKEILTHDYQDEQIVRLKGLSYDRKWTLSLKAKDRGGVETSFEPIGLVPSQVKSSVFDDQRAPAINRVRVEEVRQAIFVEATIRWDTDKFASSEVEYGLTDAYGDRARAEDVFVLDHRVKLAGLKGGKRYHFRVISRDIFGNVSMSEDFILDTGKKFASMPTDLMDGMSPLEIDGVNLFKAEGSKDIYLRVMTNRETKILVTLTEDVEMDNHGFGLVSLRQLQIDVCYKCHRFGISHPVGIRSRGAKIARIPRGLPTIKGGMLTCITCHYPHGGDRRYLSRLNADRDLCVVCHTSEPYK